MNKENEMENKEIVKKEMPIADNFKQLVNSKGMRERFEQMLNKKTEGFITSLLSLKESTLKDVEPISVLGSALKAAALDLPIDPNLGYAWIVPFKDKHRGNKKFGQFQIGYKGFIQLAMRTGQYEKINALEVYEGQFISWDPLEEELKVDWSKKKSDEVVGFVATFKTVNGFKKTIYWTKEEMLSHASKYSSSYKFQKGSSLWSTDFVAMGKKTILKNTISKWGILSIELQTAVNSDQAVINVNGDKEEIRYIDNEDEKEEAFDPFANAQVPDEVIDAEVVEDAN